MNTHEILPAITRRLLTADPEEIANPVPNPKRAAQIPVLRTLCQQLVTPIKGDLSLRPSIVRTRVTRGGGRGKKAARS